MKIENFGSTLRALDEPSSSLEHFKNMTSLHVLLGGRFLRGLMARAADDGALRTADALASADAANRSALTALDKRSIALGIFLEGEKLQTGIFSMLQESIEYGGHLNKYIIA